MYLMPFQLEGVDNSKTDINTQLEYTKSYSSFYVYKNNSFILYKQKKEITERILLDAEFDCHKYDPNRGTDTTKTHRRICLC